MSTVLLVHRGAQREAIASWLEEAGYEVELCPGPLGPDYTCVGARIGACPLAADTDVVILDSNLASDEMQIGTPSWQLLDFYVNQGRKVLVFGADLSAVYPPEQVRLWRGPVERTRILEAVGRLAGRLDVEETA